MPLQIDSVLLCDDLSHDLLSSLLSCTSIHNWLQLLAVVAKTLAVEVTN
jgi:hypothetical protein